MVDDAQRPSEQNPNESSKARTPPPIGLDVLIGAAQPLLTKWLEHKAEERADVHEHEREMVLVEAGARRHIVWAAVIVALGVLGISATLIGKGRDELAIQLITLIVGVTTAAIGGYGYAVGRRRKDEEKPRD